MASFMRRFGERTLNQTCRRFRHVKGIASSVLLGHGLLHEQVRRGTPLHLRSLSFRGEHAPLCFMWRACRPRSFASVHDILANQDIPFQRVRVVDDAGLVGDFNTQEALVLATQETNKQSVWRGFETRHLSLGCGSKVEEPARGFGKLVFCQPRLP